MAFLLDYQCFICEYDIMMFLFEKKQYRHSIMCNEAVAVLFIVILNPAYANGFSVG